MPPKAPPKSGPPDAPPKPPSPLAPDGTKVLDPTTFGVTQTAAKFFQQIADKFDVVIRVRPVNPDSLSLIRQGCPPKHYKIKSKSITGTDILLGAAADGKGKVGYFKPRLPQNLDQMPRDAREKVLGRYVQRRREYADNFKDMQNLVKDRKISIENGVVIDRGLSQTRLQGGKLVPAPGARPGGTGKPFAGDYDMFDITTRHGGKVDPGTMRQIERKLGNGPTRTQHGALMEWAPSTPRDKGIQNSLVDAHRGVAGPDGTIGPRMVDRFGKTVPDSEGLLRFAPGQQHPNVSYYR